MGQGQSSPPVVEESDGVISITAGALEYLHEGGASGPDKKVAILRKESAELRNHVLMQQKDLEMFEHSLNHAIDTVNRQEKAEADAQSVQELYHTKLAELEEEKIRHRRAAHDAFDAAAQNVQTRVRDLLPPSDSQTCSLERTNVLNCLRSNTGQPLNCSGETLAFKACARKSMENSKS